MPKNSVLSFYNKSTWSTVRFASRFFDVLTPKEGREALVIFMFGTFTGRFPSDTLVSMVEKGLKSFISQRQRRKLARKLKKCANSFT